MQVRVPVNIVVCDACDRVRPWLCGLVALIVGYL